MHAERAVCNKPRPGAHVSSIGWKGRLVSVSPNAEEAERALGEELLRWAELKRRPLFWLRDDDAIADTRALRALLDLCQRHDAPLLVAVIPMRMEVSLAPALAIAHEVQVAVHGASHDNHAPAGRKREETPPERGLSLIVESLGAARARMIETFGEAAGATYVPPWNRISPEVAALLPGLGFSAISTFGDKLLQVQGLAELPTHLDLMDWRGSRGGKPVASVLEEARLLLRQRREGGVATPIGVLAHHLVHDAAAWKALERLLAVTRKGGAAWRAFDDLVQGT